MSLNDRLKVIPLEQRDNFGTPAGDVRQAALCFGAPGPRGGSLSKTAAKRHDSGIEPFRSTADALKNKGFDFGAHDPTIVPRPPGCVARGTIGGPTPNPDETHLHPQLAEGPAPNKGGI